LPYPPNLFFIGTMDTSQFMWYDEKTLLSQTTVIPWYAEPQRAPAPPFAIPWIKGGQDSGLVLPSGRALQKFFLQSCVRRAEAAHHKLRQLPEWREVCIRPLIEIESVLVKYDPEYPTRAVTDKALIYLANAWSKGLRGLFASSFYCNLEIALDLAIAQEVLPQGISAIQTSKACREQLHTLLRGTFQYANDFLERAG